MKISVERLPDHPARVLMEIEVETERVDAAVEQAYRRIVRQLRIPGFRPGRAPRKIVELHVGKEALLQEAIDDLIPELYEEATRLEELDPVDQARIDIVDMGVDKPLKFTAEVDVKPEVTLGKYEGVAVERRVRKIEDKDVDEMVERTRQQMAQLVHSDKETLEEGDFAVVDFDGFLDGEPFQGGAGRGEMIEIGGGRMVPGFEEQLVGMTVDEQREITITFPEDYRDDLAGREAMFRVTLTEIKERQVPALDDELAKDTGRFDTLEEMRADFRRRLEEAAAAEAEDRMRSALLQSVAQDAQVDIPAVMVDHELEHMQHEMQLNLAQSGIAWEQYLAMLETTEEDWKEQVRHDAVERVKRDLVLEAVGRAEGLTPDEEAVDERLRSLLAHRGEEEVKEALADEGRRAFARNALLRSKALDWIVERAEVTEVEYTGDEVDESSDEAEVVAEEPEAGEPDGAEAAAAGDDGVTEEKGKDGA